MNGAQRIGRRRIYELMSLEASEEPTDILAILNVGQLNGLSAPQLIEAVNPFGKLRELAMPNFTSFCFMRCMTTTDAMNIYEGLHNVQRLGSNSEVCFLSYYNRLPPEQSYQPALPESIVLLAKFISEVEELEILEAINLNLMFNINENDSEFQLNGQQIVYGEVSDDPIKEHMQIIPYACKKFWPRLRNALANTVTPLAWEEPDQVILHITSPGNTGVLTDEHGRYDEQIVFLSLQDGCVVEFSTNLKKSELLISARSMVIISGDARYGCFRTIPPSHTQVVSATNGTLRVAKGNRILLRFRHFRNQPCVCKWKNFCDTKLPTKDAMIKELLEQRAEYLERRVHLLYNKLAKYVQADYQTPRLKVAHFLNTFKPNALVYDIGCGAGIYLNANPNVCIIGCDKSQDFVEVCRSKGYKAFQSDCRSLPIQSNSANGCISVGVIHHLATEEHRLEAVQELARILCKGGRGLIYVWCVHHLISTEKSRGFQPDPFELKVQNEKVGRENYSDTGVKIMKIPLNEDLTIRKPEPTDMWWKADKFAELPNSMDYELRDLFKNYCHIFSWGELETLMGKAKGLSVLEMNYDEGNICVIFRRN